MEIDILNELNKILEFVSNIPKTEIIDYPKSSWWGNNNPYADDFNNGGCYEELGKLFISDSIQERFWINKCWESFEKEIGFWGEYENYVARLNEEAKKKAWLLNE